MLSPPLLSAESQNVLPHGYGNLSEFDIILPVEERFGAGEGALWWTCTAITTVAVQEWCNSGKKCIHVNTVA